MKFSLFVLMMAFAVPARSQDSPKAEIPDDTQATAPAPLVGASPSLQPLGELVTPNFVSGGVAISGLFTDNAELATTHQISDESFNVVPHLAINSSTTRLSFGMDVLAGFLMNRTLDNRNQATQSAGLDLSYRAAQFVNFRISDHFTNTTGLFAGAGVQAGSTGPGIGTLQQPNNSLFTFGAFRSNVVLAELSGQLSADSFAGVRGSQSYLWFPTSASDPVVGTLYGGSSYSAEAFYNHHFTARNWGGITLRAQRFDLNQSVSRTDAAGLIFMYAINIRPSTTISFLGGPELSVTSSPRGVPIAASQRRLWSPVVGAVFSWQGQRTSTIFSFDRQVSNGGGLVSAVTLSTADAQIRRHIGRRLEFGPGFTFSQNDPIVRSPAIRTYSAQVQANYRVGSCQFGGGYAHDERDAVSGSLTASANRAWISFSYDFIRPLGR